MITFLPHTTFIFFATLLLIGSTLLLGFLITKIKKNNWAVLVAWSLVISSVIAMERLCNDEEAGYRMMAIIMVTLFSMKVVVMVEAYKESVIKLSFLQWLAFSAGWFGMRPKIFENLGSSALPGAKKLIVFGLTRIALGLIIFLFIKWMGISQQPILLKYILSGMLLGAISLVLHFGILNVSAGMWRLSGVNTSTLFRSPLLSTSLTEFWGKRWNLAFSEMTAIALYRPLKNSIGISAATVLAFLFSGLLHEMAISIPVKAGIGLPMLYFLLHGLLMLVEKLLEKRGVGILKNKITGRIWVIFWLIVPLPLLFHEQFIKKVVWPLIA